MVKVTNCKARVKNNFLKRKYLQYKLQFNITSVADPEPGTEIQYFLPLDPGSGMGNKPGSGIIIPVIFPRAETQFFGFKY